MSLPADGSLEGSDFGTIRSEDQNRDQETLEARDGIEPPARALQALPLASSGTAPQRVSTNSFS
jgi:hypothetical protein